ncbi:TRAP transporter small permease [Propylenella binzhouense]|uniref:TRAP transporter small permease protein n=1 Tax=Propylenella binzhouense TaxID=2555902 RepID=A0A964WTK0_9HYPH|nr:TRAP transporter small permease [Propylenella binzhouense]MYZ47930.1 TRAP transporter small permease [Propylenella binzhouense]
MTFVNWASRALELVLEIVAGVIVVALTAIVVYAVVTRTLGFSPSWYDEVASVLLAWLTYYASALAALKRGHIGFDGVLMALSPGPRLALAALAEIIVLAFFAILAWTGMVVLDVLEGSTLVSLTWVPVQLTQSVIPIGAVLFIVAELLSMPGYFAKLRAGISVEHEEVEHAVATAREEYGADVEALLRGQAGRARP